MDTNTGEVTITAEQFEEYQRLKACPKHGDKKYFRDIVLEDTGHRVLQATQEQIDEVRMLAELARDYQIEKNGNMYMQFY